MGKMNTTEAARLYLGRGFSPLPVRGGKNPGFASWQNFRTSEVDLDEHFRGASNIGLLLGVPSGGLQCRPTGLRSPNGSKSSRRHTLRLSALAVWNRCAGRVFKTTCLQAEAEPVRPLVTLVPRKAVRRAARPPRAPLNGSCPCRHAGRFRDTPFQR